MDYEFVPGRDDFPPDEIAMLRQQLAAALAAIESKDIFLDKLARLGNEPHLGNSIGNRIAYEALAIKPDASILRQHDETLIDKCIQKADAHYADDFVLNALKELKRTL